MDETGIGGLLDELSYLIEDAKSPIGNKDKRQIDAGQAFAIIDDIRERIPVELADARKTLREREDILAAAEIEHNRIVEDARNQALIIASEQEIVRIAQSQAEGIIRDAREAERQIRSGAEDYADSVLSHIQNTLETLGENIVRSRERLNNRGIR